MIVKERAAAVGLDPARYAEYSLSAGLATTAPGFGVASWKIWEQTGHVSDTMLGH